MTQLQTRGLRFVRDGAVEQGKYEPAIQIIKQVKDEGGSATFGAEVPRMSGRYVEAIMPCNPDKGICGLDKLQELRFNHMRHCGGCKERG